MKKIIILTMAAVLVTSVLAGCGGSQGENFGVVVVEDYEQHNISDIVTANGTIEGGSDEYIVSTEIERYKVKSVDVKVGDHVKKGDKLLELDTDDINRQIEETKKRMSETSSIDSNSLESKKKELQYLQNSQNVKLNNIQNSISSAQSSYDEEKRLYDEAVSNFDTSQSKYNEAKDNLSNAESDEDIAYYAGLCDLYSAEVSRYTQEKSSHYSQMSSYKDNISELQSQYDMTKMETDYQISQLTFEINSYKSDDTENKTKLEKLNEALENSVIIAPVDGVVTAVNVEKGKVDTQPNLVSIVNDNKKVIHTNVGEGDVISLEKGMDVDFYLSSKSSEILHGTITDINYIKKDTGFDLVIESDDIKDINIGMSVVNNIKLIDEDVLSVSNSAVLQRDDGKHYVFTTSDNGDGTVTLKEHEVTIGIKNKDYTEIISDELKEGDKIVSSVNAAMFDGMIANVAMF